MTIRELSPQQIDELVGTRHAQSGIEYPPIGLQPYYVWLMRTLHLLAEVSAGQLKVHRDASSDTAIRVVPGRCTLAGEPLSFAGSTADLSAFDDDTVLVWVRKQDDAATLGHASVAAGWPGQPHLKLAEVTLEGGEITGILDLRFDAAFRSPSLAELGLQSSADEIDQLCLGIDPSLDAAALNAIFSAGKLIGTTHDSFQLDLSDDGPMFKHDDGLLRLLDADETGHAILRTRHAVGDVHTQVIDDDFTITHDHKPTVHLVVEGSGDDWHAIEDDEVQAGSFDGQELLLMVVNEGANASSIFLHSSERLLMQGTWHADNLSPGNWVRLKWNAAMSKWIVIGRSPTGDMAGVRSWADSGGSTTAELSHADSGGSTGGNIYAQFKHADSTGVCDGANSHANSGGVVVATVTHGFAANGAVCDATRACATGVSEAKLLGSRTHQSGGTTGRCQIVQCTLTRTTTNATATELTITGGAPSIDDRFRIAAGKIMDCEIRITAISSDQTHTASFWRRCLIQNNAGSTSLVGSVVALGSDIGSNSGSVPAGWSVDVTADDTNDHLKITVTGAASTTIRWMAHVCANDLSSAG